MTVPTTVDSHITIARPDPKTIDPKYLGIAVGALQSEIEALGEGSTGQTELNREKLSGIQIPVPPTRGQQRTIAAILSSLDDKIELNRNTCETLEEMARVIFKSWFVDFAPVRAKAAGEKPASICNRLGLTRDMLDLFPCRLVNSELGEIPEWWEFKKWGDLISLEYGKSLCEYSNDLGKYPVYGTNGRIGTWSSALCAHPGIIIGRKGAYRGVHYCETPFYVIDTAFFIEAKVELEYRWAYYELLLQDINSMDSGSAIPSTSREDFYNLKVISPPAKIQKSFTNMLNPVWERQKQLSEESIYLSNIRDSLLPKLVSGEIEVPVGAEA